MKNAADLEGTALYIGQANGDSDLYFLEDEAAAVKFLDKDPSNKDMGAMGPSRTVHLARITSTVLMKIRPPQPAGLEVAPPVIPDTSHFLPGHGNGCR